MQSKIYSNNSQNSTHHIEKSVNYWGKSAKSPQRVPGHSNFTGTPVKIYSPMDFPPSEWDVFFTEDYSLVVPRDPGDLGAELAVQVRANGRIQDHYRISLGGSKVVEKIFPMSSLIKRAGAPAWMIKYRAWP